MLKAELKVKLLALRETKVIEFIRFAPKDSTDGAVMFEEIEDITKLLLKDLDDGLIVETMCQTTSGRLLDILEWYVKEEAKANAIQTTDI